jgi:hypothetical protein
MTASGIPRRKNQESKVPRVSAAAYTTIVSRNDITIGDPVQGPNGSLKKGPNGGILYARCPAPKLWGEKLHEGETVVINPHRCPKSGDLVYVGGATFGNRFQMYPCRQKVFGVVVWHSTEYQLTVCCADVFKLEAIRQPDGSVERGPEGGILYARKPAPKLGGRELKVGDTLTIDPHRTPKAGDLVHVRAGWAGTFNGQFAQYPCQEKVLGVVVGHFPKIDIDRMAASN